MSDFFSHVWGGPPGESFSWLLVSHNRRRLRSFLLMAYEVRRRSGW